MIEQVIGTNLLRRSGRRSLSLALLVILCSVSAKSFLAGPIQKTMHIEKRAFGKLEDGTTVDIYILKNRNGIQVEITNYGRGRCQH